MCRNINYLWIAIFTASISLVTVGCGELESDDGQIIIVTAEGDTERVFPDSQEPLPVIDIAVATTVAPVLAVDDVDVLPDDRAIEALPIDPAQSHRLHVDHIDGALNIGVAGDIILVDDDDQVDPVDEVESGQQVPAFMDGCAELKAWKAFAATTCDDLLGRVTAVQPKTQCADGRFREVVVTCELEASDDDGLESRALSAVILGGPESCKPYSVFKNEAEAVCEARGSYVYDVEPVGECDRDGADVRLQSVRVVCSDESPFPTSGF